MASSLWFRQCLFSSGWGRSLTWCVAPGCVEDGTWMLWESSSAVSPSPTIANMCHLRCKTQKQISHNRVGRMLIGENVSNLWSSWGGPCVLCKDEKLVLQGNLGFPGISAFVHVFGEWCLVFFQRNLQPLQDLGLAPGQKILSKSTLRFWLM